MPMSKISALNCLHIYSGRSRDILSRNNVLFMDLQNLHDYDLYHGQWISLSNSSLKGSASRIIQVQLQDNDNNADVNVSPKLPFVNAVTFYNLKDLFQIDKSDDTLPLDLCFRPLPLLPEDLNVLSELVCVPIDTPFYNTLPKEVIDETLHQWILDQIAEKYCIIYNDDLIAVPVRRDSNLPTTFNYCDIIFCRLIVEREQPNASPSLLDSSTRFVFRSNPNSCDYLPGIFPRISFHSYINAASKSSLLAKLMPCGTSMRALVTFDHNNSFIAKSLSSNFELLGRSAVIIDCLNLYEHSHIVKIRDHLLDTAAQHARRTSILVLDNFESLLSIFTDQSLNSAREVFLLLDALSELLTTSLSQLVVILDISQIPDTIYMEVSKCFDAECRLEMLTIEECVSIAKEYLEGYPVSDYDSNSLHGGIANLKSNRDPLLVQHFIRRVLCEASSDLSSMKDLFLADEHFLAASKWLQKTRLSQGLTKAVIPDVQWSDIGGLGNAKNIILDTLEFPLMHPELVAKSMKRRAGILLTGPPGTGKTLVAKAVAAACSLHFMSVKGPEMLNMYVGESESNIRRIFMTAKQNQPSLIFFDEIDALAPIRSSGYGGSGGVTDRVVSQLFTELDSINTSDQVYVMGATNRPDLLDPALKRPGRFEKIIPFGYAHTTPAVLEIFHALTKRFHLSTDVSLLTIAEKVRKPISGAELYSICSAALLNAVQQRIKVVKEHYNNFLDNCVLEDAHSAQFLLFDYFMETRKNELLVPLQVTAADFNKGLSHWDQEESNVICK